MNNSRIIDAVSLVLVCKGKLFYIIRQNFLTNFPGYLAYAGGKVERDESEVEFEEELLKRFPAKLMHTLCREAKEELKLDIQDQIAKKNIISIEELGLAITPDFNPYRFATYFYKIELRDFPQFDVDANEAFEADWSTPQDLLNRFYSNDLMAVPPIILSIKELAKNIKCQKVELNFNYDAQNEVPWIESIYGVKQIMPLSNTLPPANRTNAFVIGDLLVDPSPKDEQELTKFLNTIKQFEIKKIFLTHHHPDHIQYSNIIARKFNWPILLSEFTEKIILKKFGNNFFEGCHVQHVTHLQSVTNYQGKKVLSFHVPGHDRGQLALFPEDKSWFLAGDLFQGVGTVVVGDEEGDMIEYLSTLKAVMALNPKRVIPSHGIALGGTNILQKTYDHRLMREEQIRKLHQEGKTNEQILEILYADVDKRVWDYARKNIASHLVKIQREKK